ncbi:phage tail assembly protein [Dyella sp.]|uniref:phage tail assembly protein n=1 Tax=Dyella sp. TaxID=1869338 RepID=UPI002B46DA7D|nr:phage tail assembly protein [Dyella sp.]HKT28810.1 phage tail assembly protein [Dyella sp.]
MSERKTTATITLEEPIQRGTTTITDVTVRKPKSGELRGTQLVNLLHMDVAALEVILPRITQPTLTKADVANLDPADLTQFGVEVSGFLLTRANREGYPSA